MQCWIAVSPSADADGGARIALADYSYETDEHSKKLIAANDLLFLRDQTRLFAVAHVERISTEKREHAVLTCPDCGIAKIQLRKARALPYRCFHGHEFTEPVEMHQQKVIHTAYFPRDYVRIGAQIEAAELRPFERTNSRHVKLKLGDIAGMSSYIARRDHTVGPILRSWLKNRTLELGDHEADDALAAPVSVIDEPDRPFHAIRARRGVAPFREKLITRYGPRCMISGCAVPALLEACHVSKYQGPEDNHPANGILLRSDLHTLFDLDLIGINPADMAVAIQPCLQNSEYEKFAGVRILSHGDKGADMRVVRSRWQHFTRKRWTEETKHE